jgi:hypothetical protein
MQMKSFVCYKIKLIIQSSFLKPRLTVVMKVYVIYWRNDKHGRISEKWRFIGVHIETSEHNDPIIRRNF